MPKINQEEYEILKSLDDKWKWIVRNDEWQLEARKDKPFKKGHVWSEEVTNHSFSNDIDLDLFHFIQCTDINGHEEPYNIAELIKEKEVVDRAYKDGYEEGREHGFYKGYREGLANKGGEPETVADVVTTFWKSYERLKEVMSMEVEEMEKWK